MLGAHFVVWMCVPYIQICVCPLEILCLKLSGFQSGDGCLHFVCADRRDGVDDDADGDGNGDDEQTSKLTWNYLYTI